MHPLKELQSGERGESKSWRRKGFICSMTVSKRKKKKWTQRVNCAFHFPARLPFISLTLRIFQPQEFPSFSSLINLGNMETCQLLGFKGCIFILSLPQMLNEDLIQIVLWSELPGQCAVWGRGSVNPAAGGRLYFPWERLAHLGQRHLHTQFLDSLPSDRHLLSGRGERNILWLMSYGKTLAGCTRNPASVFLDFFSLFHKHKGLWKFSFDMGRCQSSPLGDFIWSDNYLRCSTVEESQLLSIFILTHLNYHENFIM